MICCCKLNRRSPWRAASNERLAKTRKDTLRTSSGSFCKLPEGRELATVASYRANKITSWSL